jgi:HEAT repeat protein
MVPKWSMSEIVEPTYNYPMSVAIKEIATKLNRLYFRSTPPADLLRRKIDAVKRDPQLDTILELGFLGSPDALPTLESLVKTSSSGNVVTYALDAIGIIGDPKSFPFLRDYHKSSESKGLLFSLKAIGDLGTPEALAYLRNVPVDHGNIEEIVELYTQ